MAPLTPSEAVLWDAMLSAGWTPTQCRVAFAAAARGTVVTARSEVRRDAYTGLARQSAGEWQRGMVLQRLGTEAAKFAHVTYDTDGDGGTVLEARLLVVPGVEETP